MINSHKELVSEIENFVDKFEFINEFKYIKDAEKLFDEIDNVKSKTLIIGLDSIDFDDAEYNVRTTYRFMIAESVLNTVEQIIDAETSSMFCLSALGDYLNYVQDAPVDFNGVTFINETDEESCFSTVSGSFEFVIKRSASYWKKMEAYSVT
jgi:hypothetical protein